MARPPGARWPPCAATRPALPRVCVLSALAWTALLLASRLPGASFAFVGKGTARASPALVPRGISRPVELVPGRQGGPCIVVISDSTGETAKQLFSKVLEAYQAAHEPRITLYGYVTKPMELAEILTMEKGNGYSEVYVVATLVEPSMIRWIEKLSVDLGIQHLNLMKPMLDAFNVFLGSQARGTAGALTSGGNRIVMQQLDDLVSKEFIGMIEAASYARSRSNSRRPIDWEDADTILVGVSRSGKTSVASFLAQRGRKVACVEIGADQPIPQGLDTAEPSKVVLIARSADHILKRRMNRVSLWRSKSVSSTLPDTLEHYATPDRVRQDQELFDQISRMHPEWMGPLDCTYVCEDETSSQILGIQRDLAKCAKLQGPSSAAEADSSPSPLLLGLVPAALALGVFLGEAGKALGEGRTAAARPPGGALGGSVLAGVGAAPGRRWRAPGRGRVAARRRDAEVRIQEEAAMRNEIRSMAQGRGRSAPGTGKCVYALSDDSGETVQLLLSRLLVQYSDLEPPSVRFFPRLGSVAEVREIVAQAQASQQDIFILATLVQPSLSDALAKFGGEMQGKTYNAIADLQRIVERSTSSSASEQLVLDSSNDGFFIDAPINGDGPVKQIPSVNSDFFRMAEAVQFAQQHISGVNAQEWPDADVLLVGPSRVGKETLAYYLAHRGVKAACVAISSAGSAPPALSNVDPRKVVLLTMSSDFLMKRRQYRVQELKRKGVPVFYDASYTNLQSIELELDSVAQLARNQVGWVGPLDITDYDIPEACDMVLTVLKQASFKA